MYKNSRKGKKRVKNMKSVILKDENIKLNTQATSKEHSIYRKSSVDKFDQLIITK